jgi:hypothetical protein
VNTEGITLNSIVVKGVSRKRYNEETDSYIVMRTSSYRMAGSKPIIDNIVDMEKTDPGILTRLLDKISEIDDNYSQRIGNMYKPLLEDNGNAKGLKGLLGTLGLTLGGAVPSTRKFKVERTVNPTEAQEIAENVVVPAMEYGIPAISAVSKYAIPAAGVALAGRGVSDIVNSFGGPADAQQSGELPLSDALLTVAALGGAGPAGYAVGKALRERKYINDLKSNNFPDFSTFMK